MITKTDLELALTKVVKKVGGTLTGILYTNRGGAVPCTKMEGSHTIPNLIDNLRVSQGQFGSVSIETAYNGLPTGWYNYIYIPHRIGGTDGDNYKYGSLFLSPMTSTDNTYLYLINYAGEVIGTPTRFSGSKTA